MSNSLNEQSPAAAGDAWVSVLRSVVSTLPSLVDGRVHHSQEHFGWTISFADGTSSVVFRETVLDRVPTAPCVLVVRFRLCGIRGRAHSLFRRESLLNTPLFAGFPGLVSKLWLEHDQGERYRGLYEWDGADRAEHYARSLWRILSLVSTRGSIAFRVLPDLRRDDVLQQPDCVPGDGKEWWRPVGVGRGVGPH
jgi:hypothetical protein